MRTVVFDSVSFAYSEGSPALIGVTTLVEPGRFVVVTGPSGSGKSTYLRCFNGLVPHSSGGLFAGSVRVGDRCTTDCRPRDLADAVGFVQQDPEAHFVVDRVEADIAFALENLGTPAETMRRRVEEVLDALDIAHLRQRSPASLSGGEKQRCAIAAAIASGPDVLVLDEPTSQLDPQGAEDVLAAVARLNSELGTTVIMSEHRLERAAPLADLVQRLERGGLAAEGSPEAVLPAYDGAPSVTRLGALLGWDPPPLTVKAALEHVRRSGPGEVEPPPRQLSTPGETVLRATGLRVTLGGREVLSGVDVSLRSGEVVALLGRNGAGKTTLLRCLAGLLDPSRGTVEASSPVAYVPQNPNMLLSAHTARAELEATLRLLGRKDSPAVDRWLVALGLEDLAERHPRSLSVGQRQRLAVAAVAIGGARVLLLDEPTRGMDAPSRTALVDAVREHAEAGGAVMLATHDVELAARAAGRIVVIGDGEMVADGRAAETLAGSLFAPQVLRVLPPFLTVDEVASAWSSRDHGEVGR